MDGAIDCVEHQLRLKLTQDEKHACKEKIKSVMYELGY